VVAFSTQLTGFTQRESALTFRLRYRMARLESTSDKVFRRRRSCPPTSSCKWRSGLRGARRQKACRLERAHLNYYRRFPGDYASKTQHLTTLEHGIYTLLLDHLYSTERPIPTIQDAYRIAKCSSGVHRAYCERVISMFFISKPTGFTNERFEKELSLSLPRIKAARANGQKGGRPKPTGLADKNPAQSSPSSIHQPNPKTPNLTVMQKLGVPLSLWRSFSGMREKIHRPIAPGAEDLIFTELIEFQQKGFDPIEILEQAIRTSSYTLYAPNGKGKGNGSHESFAEQRSRKSASAIETVLGRLEKTPRDIHRALPPANK
jgi:uncharacterized protein YdaU (DUF1376 family)